MYDPHQHLRLLGQLLRMGMPRRQLLLASRRLLRAGRLCGPWRRRWGIIHVLRP